MCDCLYQRFDFMPRTGPVLSSAGEGVISNSHDWFRKGWARLAPSGYGIKDDSGTVRCRYGPHRGKSAESLVPVHRFGMGINPDLMADLVSRRVTVLVATGGTISARAAKAATTTIPIVFTTGDDPVRVGLVPSLSRPGGNVTGVSVFAARLGSKRLGLLLEMVPKASPIAVLVNPTNPDTEDEAKEIQEAAGRLGVRYMAAFGGDPDIEPTAPEGRV